MAKHFDEIPDDDMVGLNMPAGIPLKYKPGSNRD
jgi:bisphosphoglycerate-dependent phosphoglycerate mutase